MTACLTGAVEAEAGVNFCAICAMKTPRPATMAEVITMLRMTPRSLAKSRRDFTMPRATGRLSSAGRDRHFREEDERKVNASRSARLDPARRQRARGVFR